MPEQAAIWFVSLIICLYDTVDQLHTQIEGFRSTRDRKKNSSQYSKNEALSKMTDAQKVCTPARTGLHRWDTVADVDNMKKLHRVSVCTGVSFKYWLSTL